MSRNFIEALSGELNKEASRKIVGAAYKRVQRLGRKARHQARVGAGLKGRTKLGEDMTPDLKKIESQAKTMESRTGTKAPAPATPTPMPKTTSRPMPSMGNKATELKKMSSAAGVLLRKIAEGPVAGPITTPPQQTMEQQTTGQQKIPTPKPPKPLPMPSTGTALSPLGAKTAADDAKGAGAIIKAIMGDTEEQPGEYSDEQQIGVDDPRFGGGQGLKNFGKKKAATFTDRFNPTDVPQAFGKKAMKLPGFGSQSIAPSKKIPGKSNPSYGTGGGAKCGCGKAECGAACKVKQKIVDSYR